MRILYRADGGHPIGTGHIFRAIRVLRALEAKTHLDATLFVGGDDAAVRLASNAPARVIHMSTEIDAVENKPILRAAPLLQLMESNEFDLTVIDMLDTSNAEMLALASTRVPIVCFDDRGTGRIHASAMVNILIAEPDPKSLPPAIRLYEGGPYAALDPVFAHSRGCYSRMGALCKVFVSMGGADAAGLTVKVARALRDVKGLEGVDLIAGPAFVHSKELEEVIAGAPWNARILPPQPNLLSCYMDCDLAIIAGGLTMYEVCCVGVPSLAVCQPIDHQLELSARLASEGAMVTIGDGTSVTEAQISEAVSNLRDLDKRMSMSAIGPRLVDGRGCERIADVLLDIAARPVQ